MAKICDPCAYYTPADAETVCPGCALTLRITLLPPPGPITSLSPPADAPPLRVRRRAPGGEPVSLRGIAEALTGSAGGLFLLVILTGVLASMAWGWVTSDPATGPSDDSGRIRVGMPMHEVAQVIEGDDTLPSPPGTRLTNEFPPDCRKSGTLKWRENHRLVTVDFVDGKVKGVRDEEAGQSAWGDTGRRTMITYD